MTQAVPSPAVETEQEIFEQHGIEPVGADHRYGVPFSQFRIWFGANAVVSSLFVGALGPVVFSLNFISTLTAIIVGTVVAALAVGFASTLGPRTGMVQILFSRYIFGIDVGRVLGFFNAIYCYAWSAVNLVTGTLTVQLAFALMGASFLGSGKGSYSLWVLVIAAITITVSVLGYNLVHGWEKWSTLASIIVFAVLTVAILAHHPAGGSTTVSGGQYWKNWVSMVLAAFGFGIGWIPYVSDYSRKLPVTSSPRAVFSYAFLGLTLSACCVEAVGALAAAMAFKTVSGTDVVHGIPAILGNHGWVVIALLIVGLSTISNNVPNDYTGGLSIQAAGIHVHRWLVTLIGGILSALGAIFFLQNFSGKLEEFLLMVSYWVGAWFVLLVFDHAKRGGHYNPSNWDNARALPFNLAALIAFIAALAGAWIGMFPGPDVSWNVLGQGLIGSRLGVDFGFVMAIVVALVVRTLLDMVLPRPGDEVRRAA